jgi:MoxR-like ATPase
MLAAGKVQPVLNGEAITTMRQQLMGILVREELVAYLVDIVRATRHHESVLVGAGPRATQALLLASRAYAALAGRDFVTPDDIKVLAVPVLEHRLILRPEFEIEGVTVREVIGKILEGVAVPR